MIQLTKLNGASVFVNPDLIRWLEPLPDTILSFSDGSRLAVLETAEIVRERIVAFRRACAPDGLESSEASEWTS